MPLVDPAACLSVVMPCFNEEATIEEIVPRVLDQPSVGELIIVDDGSKDRTPQLIEKLAENDDRIRFIRQARNLGKGAALRRGIAEATRPFVIIQDADLEYDPADYDTMLAPLLDGRADVCYGSRFHNSRPHRVLYFWHAVGNSLLTLASNMASNVNFTDMETCYKAFRREVIQAIDIEEDRFGFEPEITAKVAGAGHRLYEVGVSYSGRTYEEGKKIGWRDGLWALWCIGRYNAASRRGRPQPARHPTVLEETDETQSDTFESPGDAREYAGWIVDLFHPYLGERVLEVGAGCGAPVERKAARAHVTATGSSLRCVGALQQRFADVAQVDVRPLNLHWDDAEDLGSFDSVVLANVLEHLPDDCQALSRAREYLRPGGTALVHVPAQQLLNSRSDRAVGKHRRYNRSRLAAIARQAGLVVTELRYVGPPGAVAWLSAVPGLRRLSPPAAVGGSDRRVVQRLRGLDEPAGAPFGRSLFLAAQRPLAGAD